MNNTRRSFLSQVSLIAGATALSKPLSSVAAISKRMNTLYTVKNRVTVYNTHNLHGNINTIYNDMGGLKQVNALLKNQDTGGLMLDAGNFLGNTGNVSNYKEVIGIMNRAGYHAAAIGENELAIGQSNLAQLAPLMQFNLVNCNYGLNSTLSKVVKPYIIINSGNYKIGITGVGQKVSGVAYNDAALCANKTAKMLKEDKACDMVICLLNLQTGDKAFAQLSENIDMIISAHTGKLLGEPLVMRNKIKHEVIISRGAQSGLMIGKTTFGFDDGKIGTGVDTRYIVPGQTSGQNFAASFAKVHNIQKQLLSA